MEGAKARLAEVHKTLPEGVRIEIFYDRNDLIEKAVWGMMPKTKLGKAMVKKLKVFAGPEHTHQAQMPEPLDIRKDK